MLCCASRERVGQRDGCDACVSVWFVLVVRILVRIVVSIPACHAGDPGSIPGREALLFVRQGTR